MDMCAKFSHPLVQEINAMAWDIGQSTSTVLVPGASSCLVVTLCVIQDLGGEGIDDDMYCRYDILWAPGIIFPWYKNYVESTVSCPEFPVSGYCTYLYGT
jgi:hypothetical protein